MSIDLSKIKERIAKMLAKADNNTNEHEAAAAAQMARKLMDKYQIDEIDIGAITDGQQFGEELSDETYKYMPKWKNILSVAIGRYNDCESDAVTHSGDTYQIRWMGFKDDVKIAKQMYNYLCAVIDQCTSVYMRDQGYTRYNARVGTVFKEAMAARLCSRLREMTKEREAEATTATGTSLIVVKSTAVAEYFGEVKYGEVKYKAPSKPDELIAAVAGQAAGEKAAINTVLEAQ
jgi:Protein of unknown function (DUF2786)